MSSVALNLDSPAVNELPTNAQSVLQQRGLFGMGEAFMNGEWDVPHLDDFLFQIMKKESTRSAKVWGPYLQFVISEYFHNAQRGRRAFEVAKRHYDLGNDLFTVMLDSTMTYTCGLWETASTLQEAQTAKLEAICQKLKLRPGMRVLDIGCGWGNFADYAARKYGVSVVGLTVSKEQAALAQERCKGLDVSIVLKDYNHYSGIFDRVVSIEMIEAVGRKNLPGFYSMIHRCLKPDGIFVLQAISGETFSKYSSPGFDQFGMWMLKYIFPNGYLPTMHQLMDPVGKQFRISSLENFAADYDRTLQAWYHNFEKGWASLEGKYGARFFRMWRYYLHGCMASFRAQRLQLYQIAYSKIEG